MKTTIYSGLDHLIYDAIVNVKEAKVAFEEVEKEFYNKDSPIDIQKAINLKSSKEQFEKASMRLYDVLTAERILKELEKKGIEL